MPKDGDRVRVVLEGVARWHGYYRAFELGNDGKSNSIFPGADHVVSVEVLPPPIPDDAIGQTPGGYVVYREGGEWVYPKIDSFATVPVSAPVNVVGRRS